MAIVGWVGRIMFGISSFDSKSHSLRKLLMTALISNVAYFPRCIRSAISVRRYLALAVVLTISANLTAQDVPQQDRPIIEAPPLPGFSLSITRDGVRGESKVDVYLKQMFEPFLKLPGRKIEWNPKEYLENTKLVCALTGKELEIGHDESSPIWIDYTTDPIYLDKPGKLELKVTSPQSIEPGVYQGKLKVRFAPFPVDAVNALIDGYWPITIIVHGRILTELKFARASTSGLHVGQAATVTALLDTIGCEPGIGELTVRFTPLAGSPRPLLNLPMPNGTFLDPLVDLERIDHREKVCPEWRDQVLHSAVELVENETSISGYRQYRITFHAGPCFAPGESIDAELSWPQAESAPLNSKSSFTRQCAAAVSGGILVTPQIAFDTEDVHIQVISRQDLGPKVELTLIAPDSQHGQITLTRPPTSSNQPDSTGILYTYYVKFPPGQLGAWRVTWPTTDSEVEVEAAHPGHFNVWGRRINHLGYPVRVFASETPIGWGWRSNPYKGRGYYEYRFNAFELGIDSRFAGNVELHPLLIYSGTSKSGEVIPWSPDQHPYLYVAPGTPKICAEPDRPCPAPDGSVGDPLARPVEYAVEAPPKSTAIALPGEGLLPFSVWCSVIPVADEHPRKTLRTHTFTYRAMLRGTDGEGHPFARIVEIPVKVQVTDHWEYYREWALWALGIIVLVGTAGFLAWRAMRGPRPQKVLSTGLPHGPDEFPEFTGGSFSPQQSENQQSSNDQTVRKEKPGKETRKPGLNIPPPSDNSHLGDF